MTCIIIMSACAESLYPPKLLVTIHIFKAKEARDSIWHIFFFFSLYQHLLEYGRGNSPSTRFFFNVHVLVLSTIADLFFVDLHVW